VPKSLVPKFGLDDIWQSGKGLQIATACAASLVEGLVNRRRSTSGSYCLAAPYVDANGSRLRLRV
jgi:hypothetical protein